MQRELYCTYRKHEGLVQQIRAEQSHPRHCSPCGTGKYPVYPLHGSSSPSLSLQQQQQQQHGGRHKSNNNKNKNNNLRNSASKRRERKQRDPIRSRPPTRTYETPYLNPFLLVTSSLSLSLSLSLSSLSSDCVDRSSLARLSHLLALRRRRKECDTVGGQVDEDGGKLTAGEDYYRKYRSKGFPLVPRLPILLH